MVQGQGSDPGAQAEEERARHHEHRVRTVPTGGLEGVVEIAGRVTCSARSSTLSPCAAALTSEEGNGEVRRPQDGHA